MALSAALTRLINNVKTRVPGALDDAMQREIFNTLDEFFQNSNIWREDIVIPILGDGVTTSYSISPAETANINRLMWVFNTALVRQNATMQVPGTLDLDQAPNQADTYTATVALTCSDPTTLGYPAAPDWIISKYASGLLDGALGKLMSQPNKPYNNERMSIFHMRRFISSIATARVEANHRNTYERPNWAYPQSFAVSRRRF